MNGTTNVTLINNPDLCTLSTCPLSLAHVQYRPSIPGNAIYAALFGVLLVIQIGLGIRHRIWGFMGGMFGGVILELIGYIARLMIHNNPFNKGSFLMYLICLTIGPAFLSASIYLCLARIVVVYGEHISRFSPRTYTLTFITFDFVALLLQAAGGAIASSSSNSSTQTGIHIMVAGVGWQVASLGIFAILCAEFAWRVHRTLDGQLNPDFVDLRKTLKFRGFLWALGLATLAIFVRSLYRCLELEGGFRGKLANEQIPFMILEGAMISSAVLLLTVFHPGFAFGGGWHDAAWKLGKKTSSDEKKVPVVKQSKSGNKWTRWAKRGRGNDEEAEKMSDIEAPQYQA